MSEAFLCLDSGTSAVKAAAFSRDGRLLALEEVPNRALAREGSLVEQDMDQTRADAFEVLARCVARLEARPLALIVTGQGDGVWPLDAERRPAGRAITWLDGRTGPLLREYRESGALDRVTAVTLSRPTGASAPIQLAWLARHEPERLARIAHALRCKEWLFFALTGELLGEPSAIQPSWGDWRRQAMTHAVEEALGLARGLDLLPPLAPVAETQRPLSPEAAAATGLPAGLPVILGPGDVQATAIGLGIGIRDGVERASIFGTSAIQIRHRRDLSGLTPEPPGAMLQPFIRAGEFLRFHPSFNGAVALSHLERLMGQGSSARPAFSGLVLHPFFEAGGERSPVTDPAAQASLFGMNAATTPAEIAWAGREALAFLARQSHDAMGDDRSAVALGGGLAADRDFAQLFATTLQRPVQRATTPHAGLAGLGLVAAWVLGGGDIADKAETWLHAPAETVQPESGPVADYLARKFALFARLLDAARPLWHDLATMSDAASALQAAIDGELHDA